MELNEWKEGMEMNKRKVNIITRMRKKSKGERENERERENGNQRKK